VTPAARLSGLGTTIFTEMSALAERTDALNLGQGSPDADGPAFVLDAAVAALRAGDNQYAPLPGVPALRDAVREHQRR
jgi:N-succinyldiaminopimelate aminotransferase